MEDYKGMIIDCKSSSVVLVITGCISPIKDQAHLVLKDVDERIRQYLKSIKYYIEDTDFYNIVFCENSAYELEERFELEKDAEALGKHLEWLSFNGNLTEEAKYSNKGIGEDEIMDYIFNNSQLIQNAKTFVKVTGRLILNNINSIIKYAHYGSNYFYRDLYGNVNHGVDTRFYVVDTSYYKNCLRNCYTKTDDKEMRYEDAFYVLMDGKYELFPIYPRFHGSSSGNGKIYDDEGETKLKFLDLMCRLRWYNKYYSFIYYYFKIIRKFKGWRNLLLQ